MLKAYKNYIYTAIVLIYSFFLWNVSSKVTENKYLKDAQEAIQAAVDAKQRTQDIADEVGKTTENKLRVYQQQNKKLKELLDGMAKDPVYRECLNTPDVMQHFTDKINRANEAIGK